MTRARLAVPASVVVNDRVHQSEQNYRFWRGVFKEALAHRERRLAERRRAA